LKQLFILCSQVFYDAEDAVCFLVIPVEGELIINIERDKTEGSKTDSQPDNINGGETFASHQRPRGGDEIIFKHRRWTIK
jgi:hypothetical protein